MSVQNVVLGQLIQRRGYGYELADRLRVWAGALQLSDAAVYSALRQLASKGLVSEVGHEEAALSAGRRSPRVIFEVTEKGRRHFDEWMASHPRSMPLREELHMQMLVAEDCDVPHLIESLKTFERECRDHLARVLSISLDINASAAHARINPVGAVLVKDALASHLQATVEWAQRSRRSLENHLSARSPDAPGRCRP